MAALRKKISSMFYYGEDTQNRSQSNAADAVRGSSLDSGFYSMPKSVNRDISPKKLQKAASTTFSSMFSLAALSETLRSKTASFHADKSNVEDAEAGRTQVQTPKKQNQRSARFSATLSRSSARLRKNLSSHRGFRRDEWGAGSPTTPPVVTKEIPPAIDVDIPSSFLNDQATKEPSLTGTTDDPSVKLAVAPRILWPQATRVAMSEGSPKNRPAGSHSSSLGSPYTDSPLVDQNDIFTMMPLSKDTFESLHTPKECQCPMCGAKYQKSEQFRVHLASCVPPELGIEHENENKETVTTVSGPTNEGKPHLRPLSCQHFGERSSNDGKSSDAAIETQLRNTAVEASEPESCGSSKAAFAKEAFTRLNTSEATIHDIEHPKSSYRPPVQSTTSVKTGLKDLPASKSFTSPSNLEQQLELVTPEVYEADAEESPLIHEASSMGPRSSWAHTRSERHKRYLALPKYDEETRSNEGSDLALESSRSSMKTLIEADSANLGAAEPRKVVTKGDLHYAIEAIERESGSNWTEPLTTSDSSSIQSQRRSSGEACEPQRADAFCLPDSMSKNQSVVDPRVDLTVPDLLRDDFHDPLQKSFDGFHASFRVFHDERKPRISFKELEGFRGTSLKDSDVAKLSPLHIPVPASDDPYEAAIKAAGLSVEPHMRSSSAFSDSTASSCAVTTHSRLGSSPSPHPCFHIRSGPARTTSDIIESLDRGEDSSPTVSCFDENAPPSIKQARQVRSHAKKVDVEEVGLEHPREDVNHCQEPPTVAGPPKSEITVSCPAGLNNDTEQAQNPPKTNREILRATANNLKISTNDGGPKQKSKPQVLLRNFEPALGPVTTYPKPNPETDTCIGGGRNGVYYRDDTDIIGHQVPQARAHTLATSPSCRTESDDVHEPVEVGETPPELGSKVGLDKHLAELHMRFIYNLEEDTHGHNEIEKDGTTFETQSLD